VSVVSGLPVVEIRRVNGISFALRFVSETTPPVCDAQTTRVGAHLERERVPRIERGLNNARCPRCWLLPARDHRPETRANLLDGRRVEKGEVLSPLLRIEALERREQPVHLRRHKRRRREWLAVPIAVLKITLDAH
jgi:hypothetical protein